ncbi:hypothetical protein NDU88_006011 [Pleurodeles waltl]|uniref:Uncharacterized protein n=1 Tax=Pleurodeles waltl TaxID=8319 RepID=A0AAV7TX25_PLEWA|nr:hypothetical protein NDU88_006011 [Pleurodeles waltl]
MSTWGLRFLPSPAPPPTNQPARCREQQRSPERRLSGRPATYLLATHRGAYREADAGTHVILALGCVERHEVTGVSKGTQAQSKEIRCICLPPVDYSLFPPPCASPTAYTRAHGFCQMDGQEIWITVDFSKETSERRRAFLVLCPRLRQMEVKYGLFEPARMWVMKNGVSQDFYDP